MTTQKRALTVLILAAVAIAAVGGFGMLAGAQESDTANGTATVTFENQSSDGTTVTVASAETSEGGFMAMHTAALLDGEVLDSTLGQAQIESGQVSDVEVPLFNVPGQTAFGDQSALQEDQTLIAMPHKDTNDNGNYDFITSNGSEDGPYTANGSAVVDPAFITLESEDGGDEQGQAQDQDADGKAKQQDDGDGAAADDGDGKAKQQDDGDGAADGGDGKAKQQDDGDGAADGDGAGGKAKQGGDGGQQQQQQQQDGDDGAADGGNGKAKLA
ncbi:hypothetical protein BRC90_04490 [Halobacteriales archaeon QS_4_69_34]|nr:MAG: hypothetical protein BRC90_04490 [Halobacteriales archaeon QS_4_69_34]